MLAEIALRAWTPDDAEWYVRQIADPEIRRFTTEPATLTVEDFREALDRLASSDDELGWVAVDPLSGERLANVAAVRNGDTAIVSYWVTRNARGKGVATQALDELCARALTIWPITEFRLYTHADNLASQRVAEKAGFHRMDGMPTQREVYGQKWPVRWFERLR
ncbi:GNAT family N-acetyltransferase [Amycolatopsis magusensis]|uniref:GNAT family N-acetyltransferase n=1 Tax=Amycolatopsis magusensis TaxID=882444 RepID=UPI0024A9EA65|nr:GNAT family protein [Amycolatopsis magusensis]MDI5980035.1 GNAT family protein [Amycolatopsis magusensis]